MHLSGSTPAVVAALTQWLGADDDEPLMVETSGSTGAPKRVVLSRGAVLASVRATERRLGGTGRWLLALPTSYVAGALVVCRSVLAGHPPVLLDDHSSLAEAVAVTSPEFVSVVSTQLHRMLDEPEEAEALRSFRAVLVGGGPVDRSLRERAVAESVPVVATYGSAETSGGCVYDGVPLDAVGLAVDAVGRIRLTGPMLFDRYDDDPVLTASVLVDGWYLTSDAGRIDEDGRLHVLGRLDDIVVSGGVNVPGPAVAARLRLHPDVVDAEVIGERDPEWGNRVTAFVVGHLDLDEARDWVAQVHPRSWAPRRLVLLDEMPMLANGKPDRERLRGLAG